MYELYIEQSNKPWPYNQSMLEFYTKREMLDKVVELRKTLPFNYIFHCEQVGGLPVRHNLTIYYKKVSDIKRILDTHNIQYDTRYWQNNKKEGVSMVPAYVTLYKCK